MRIYLLLSDLTAVEFCTPHMKKIFEAISPSGSSSMNLQKGNIFHFSLDEYSGAIYL